MEINGLRFPDELYYDEHHQWARLEDGLVTVGLTDYAQRSSGDVVFIELPRRGLAVRREQAFGSIESGKWVGRLYAPISGTVLEVNERLSSDPRTINRDPYGAGWIVRIRPNDIDELTNLMRADAARTFVEAELERERLTAVQQGDADGES